MEFTIGGHIIFGIPLLGPAIESLTLPISGEEDTTGFELIELVARWICAI